MGCGNCEWYDDCMSICTCPGGRNIGDYVDASGSCIKWSQKTANAMVEYEKPRAENKTDPEKLDTSFLIQFVRQNSRFDADLLAKIIEEWKQFKKLGSCGECKHWHEETAYCELNSFFVDHEGLCCSPAESPNWTMWEKTEFCSRFDRRETDGKGNM